MSDFAQLSTIYNPREDQLGLRSVCTDQPFRSSDVIVLTTPDPDTHPLPDAKFLEIQWVLNRVAALQGAADPEDLFYDDSKVYSGSDGGYFPEYRGISSGTVEKSSPASAKRPKN